MKRALGRKAGFTLTELLTVLVVIGILAAIAVPRLARGRLAALHSACVTNERNLATAIQTYANDHLGKFPTDLEVLTEGPNPPVKILPVCPSGEASYKTLYQVNNNEGRYTIACIGRHYIQLDTVQAGYPQYTSASGLDATGEP